MADPKPRPWAVFHTDLKTGAMGYVVTSREKAEAILQASPHRVIFPVVLLEELEALQQERDWALSIADAAHKAGIQHARHTLGQAQGGQAVVSLLNKYHAEALGKAIQERDAALERVRCAEARIQEMEAERLNLGQRAAALFELGAKFSEHMGDPDNALILRRMAAELRAECGVDVDEGDSPT